MTAAIFLSAVGVTCTILITVITVVWRLGSRQGATLTKLDDFTKTLERSDEAGASWSKQVLDAIREFDEKVTDLNQKQAQLEHEWRAAHRMFGKVQDHEQRLATVEALCEERHRKVAVTGPCASRPYLVEEGAPEESGFFAREEREKP